MEDILEHKCFVVFTLDGIEKGWWHNFMKKPFWHVFIVNAYKKNNNYFINIIEPYFIPGCKIKFLIIKKNNIPIVNWYSYFKAYRDMCINFSGNAPVIMEVEKRLEKYNFLQKVITSIPFCNNYVKKYLGIASYSITPHQLYRQLKKRGFINLFV
jgi:hypothetical protein